MASWIEKFLCGLRRSHFDELFRKLSRRSWTNNFLFVKQSSVNESAAEAKASPLRYPFASKLQGFRNIGAYFYFLLDAYCVCTMCGVIFALGL